MTTADPFKTMERMVGEGTLLYARNGNYARVAIRTPRTPQGFVQSRGLVTGWVMSVVIAERKLPKDLVADLQVYEAMLGPHEPEFRFSQTGGLWHVVHTIKPPGPDVGRQLYREPYTGDSLRAAHTAYAQLLREQSGLTHRLMNH